MNNVKKNWTGLENPPGSMVEEISPQIIFTEEGKKFNVISPSALFESPGYTLSGCSFKSFLIHRYYSIALLLI